MKNQTVKFREKEFRIVASKSMNYRCQWCALQHYRCELICDDYRIQVQDKILLLLLIPTKS